jgi:hypothetical protein
MTEDRIKLTDVPSTSVAKCLKRYGLGSNALFGKRLAALNSSRTATEGTEVSGK